MTTKIRASEAINLAKQLPALDGVSPQEMPVKRCRLVAAKYGEENGHRIVAEKQWEVIFAHPAFGDIQAYVTLDGYARWPYLGLLCEVNGVVYSSLTKARLVREALAAEGIPHHYPGTREANAALKKHGVVKTPKVGEKWGCGCEFGVIEKFTADSRAIIRQTIPGGLVAVGDTFELPIHVLSRGANANC